MQSYSFANKQKNLIETSPHFATLVAEEEDSYIFQFVFKTSKTAIINKSLTKVVIKCVNSNVFIDNNSNIQKLSASPQQKKATISQTGKFEIENILFKHARQLKLATAKRNSVIAEETINLYELVGYNVAKALRSGKKAAEIEEMYSYLDCLELTNGNFEISQFSSLIQKDIRDLNLELIASYLIHPAKAVNDDINVDIIKSIRNYYTHDALQFLPREKAYYTSIKKKKLVDKISIPVFLTVPKRLVQGNFDVHFEVLKLEWNKTKLTASEVPVERKIASVNLFKHLKFFKQPIIRPTLHAPTEDFQEVMALQKDVNSNYLKIEKKEMNNRGECTRYVTLSEDSTTRIGESTSVSESIPDNKFNIFRCISGDSITTILNPRVDGIISGKVIPIDSTRMIISNRIGATDAVEITIKYPPPYASQFQVSRSTWSGSHFGRKEIIAPYQNFDGTSSMILDTLVKNGNIYEYFLSYKTLSGEVRTSISQLHDYKKINPINGATVVIDSPQASIVNGRLALRFNILTSELKNSENSISHLINQTSSNEALKNALNGLKSADKIDDVIYHKVARINLRTGVREYFNNIESDTTIGFTPGVQFLADDERNRRKHGIEQLDSTADYLYEVRTFVRNPLSLVKGFIQLVALPPTSVRASPKIFYYNPHKWRQPDVLETGTISAVDDHDNFLTKKIEEDGEIGVTATYLLTGTNRLLSVSSPSVERIDINKVKLSWGLVGDIVEFDHFVIVKEVNRVRSLLGAVIGQELIDFLNPNDVGTIIYYVIPVLYDFSTGTATRSNAIIVDPEELQFKQQISEI